MACRDFSTRDLFEVPQPAAPLPGSMNFRLVVCGLVSNMLKDHGRIDVAATASKLTGREVTTYMLDAYCAGSRTDYNLPAFMVPALEVAAESYAFSNWLAATRGGRLLIGRDALAAELGRIQREQDVLSVKARAIKDRLWRDA